MSKSQFQGNRNDTFTCVLLSDASACLTSPSSRTCSASWSLCNLSALFCVACRKAISVDLLQFLWQDLFAIAWKDYLTDSSQSSLLWLLHASAALRLILTAAFSLNTFATLSFTLNCAFHLLLLKICTGSPRELQRLSWWVDLVVLWHTSCVLKVMCGQGSYSLSMIN